MCSYHRESWVVVGYHICLLPEKVQTPKSRSVQGIMRGGYWRGDQSKMTTDKDDYVDHYGEDDEVTLVQLGTRDLH